VTYLRTVNNDVRLDFARGLIPGISVFHRFGENPAVGAAFEDIWAQGGAYPWPTTAETLRVKSGGNAADDAGGAGAQKIKVQFLDSDWTLQEEELTLAGTSASAETSATARRLIRAWVTDCGTYTGTNTGDIIIENSSSAQTLGDIAAGIGQTQLSMYTVPSAKRAFLTRIEVNVDASKPADVRFWQRRNADDVTTPFTAKRLVAQFDQLAEEGIIVYDAEVEFPAKTDIWASAAVAATGGSVDVNYDLVLVDD
jgi:hypothetical protein